MKKGWYTKSNYVHLWYHLLLKASHEPKEFWLNGKNCVLSAGQFVTGRKALSSETGIKESTVERILNCFTNEQQIEQQKNTANRLISILNWKEYQDSEHLIEQQKNSRRTTGGQRADTINNGNNDNNVISSVGDTHLLQIVSKEKKRFVKPTRDELSKYFSEIGVTNHELEAEKFIDKYDSTGWVLNRGVPMKDWKAAARTWKNYIKPFSSNGNSSSDKKQRGFNDDSIGKFQDFIDRAGTV